MPELAFGPLAGTALLASASVFGLCTIAAVVIATGFGYHDPSDVKLDERWAREAAGPADDEEERTSISLGWLVHAALSVKARDCSPRDAPLEAACPAGGDPPRANAGGVAA